MAHRKSEARVSKAKRVAHFRQQSAANAPAPHAKASWAALATLEQTLRGWVVLPKDPGYNKARQEANPAFQSYPQLIVYCVCESDVLLCINFAQTVDAWIAVRSGGHSTAGYSVNDSMVVDVSHINGVFIDDANALVYAGGGADWDKFNATLNNTGWHVPTGACGSVCVAGFVQGGGYGYTSRAYGIQSDCVRSFRVALANGSIINVSASQNADLFWAMRGGTGGNFGVLLQTCYQMVKLPQVWAWAIAWDYAYAAQALTLMQQQYMKSGTPDQVGYMMNIGFQAGTPVYMVQGMYAGSRSDGMNAIASLLAIPTAQLLVDQVGTYPDMDSYLEDHPYGLPDQPDGTPEGKACGYIDKPLAQSDWQRIVDYVKTSPNPWSLVYTEPYGGAINRYPVADSAFVHRNVDMDLVVDIFWRNDGEKAQMQSWLAGLMQICAPFMNGQVYQNYPNSNLQNFAYAYWGDAYPRLQQVKRAYDPNNFFRYQQSIVAAS